MQATAGGHLRRRHLDKGTGKGDGSVVEVGDLSVALSTPELGDRVKRGPHWRVGDEDDGGDGSLGTVIDGQCATGMACVVWDNGRERSYCCGRDGKYEIVVVLDAGGARPVMLVPVVPALPTPGTVVVHGKDWEGGCALSGFVLPGCMKTGWVPVWWSDGTVTSCRWGADGGKLDLEEADESVRTTWSDGMAKLAKPPAAGDRVRRGPDWKWGEQDSRALGTAIGGVAPTGTLWVRWDIGTCNLYRWGADGGKMDLAVEARALPCSRPVRLLPPIPPIGTRVRRGTDWVWGAQDGGNGSLGTIVEGPVAAGTVPVRWDAGGLNQYRWGLDGKLDLEAVPKAAPAPALTASTKLPVLRPGTVVHRGPHWSWADQDGGAGKLGVVVDGLRAPGWVRVRWDTGVENVYRWGAHGGKQDVSVIRAASGMAGPGSGAAEPIDDTSPLLKKSA